MTQNNAIQNDRNDEGKKTIDTSNVKVTSTAYDGIGTNLQNLIKMPDMTTFQVRHRRFN